MVEICADAENKVQTGSIEDIFENKINENVVPNDDV